jgi:hypothetical protein
MKPTLYLETSIVSYLTARPSHDLIRAAHQQVTRDWWEMRSHFEIYISQLVLDEAGVGNTEAAKRRLSALQEALLLNLTPEAGRLAQEILDQGGMLTMPRKDPIIEEIHTFREEIAREADYDIEKILEAARARQAASGREAVTLSPKKATTAKKAS